MSRPVHLGKSRHNGKLDTLPRVDAVGEATTQNRLHIRDRVTGQRFLIDTGAEISIIAATPEQKKNPTALRLFAANNSRIETYGERRLNLDLGLRRIISWNFCVAAVPCSIIGADLLKHFGLDVSVRRRRLIDSITKLYSSCSISTAPIINLSTIDRTNEFARILAEFPELTSTMQQTPPKAKEVLHFISTNGPPISERPRRLPPEKLKAAKAEFKRLME